MSTTYNDLDVMERRDFHSCFSDGDDWPRWASRRVREAKVHAWRNSPYAGDPTWDAFVDRMELAASDEH